MNLASRPITERLVSSDDGEFLFQVYASTRAEELAAAGWPPAQQESFLRMQFNIRLQSYASAYPEAACCILLAGGVPAGSAIVWRGPREIRIVDVALLPEFRNRGIGSEWLSGLIREASSTSLPLRLSVFRGNPAARLYERLGFAPTGGDSMYIEMEHHGPDFE